MLMVATSPDERRAARSLSSPATSSTSEMKLGSVSPRSITTTLESPSPTRLWINGDEPEIEVEDEYDDAEMDLKRRQQQRARCSSVPIMIQRDNKAMRRGGHNHLQQQQQQQDLCFASSVSHLGLSISLSSNSSFSSLARGLEDVREEDERAACKRSVAIGSSDLAVVDDDDFVGMGNHCVLVDGEEIRLLEVEKRKQSPCPSPTSLIITILRCRLYHRREY